MGIRPPPDFAREPRQLHERTRVVLPGRSADAVLYLTNRKMIAATGGQSGLRLTANGMDCVIRGDRERLPGRPSDCQPHLQCAQPSRQYHRWSA